MQRALYKIVTTLSSICLSATGLSASFDSLNEQDAWQPMPHSGWVRLPETSQSELLAVHQPQRSTPKLSRKIKVSSREEEFTKLVVPTEKFESFANDLGSLIGLTPKPNAISQHKIKSAVSSKASSKANKKRKPDPDLVKAQSLLSELKQVRMQLLSSITKTERSHALNQVSHDRGTMHVEVSNSYLEKTIKQAEVNPESPSISLSAISGPASGDLSDGVSHSPYVAVETLDQAYQRFRKEQGLPATPRMQRSERKEQEESKPVIDLVTNDKVSEPAGVVSATSTISYDVTQKETRQNFDRAQDELLQVELDVLIVDERSSEEADILYPVAGLLVTVNGTQISATTDTLGHARLPGLSDHSRYLIKVTDAEGRIYPSMREVALDQQNPSQNLTLKVMRKFSLENMAQTVSTQQRADKGSLCGTVKDGEYPARDIQVSVAGRFEGPFYFNEFGLVDPTLQATTENGRFCLLNVNPGMTVMRFANHDQKLFEIPYSYAAGWHKEDDFNVTGIGGVEVKLGVVAPSFEQLDSDTATANGRTSSDFAAVVPLGEEAPMEKSGQGRVVFPKNAMFQAQRLWLYAYGPELETIIQSQTMNGSDVLTLVPRGFMEDMALRAEVPFDHQLGHVYVEFGHWRDLSDDVQIDLVDTKGQSVAKPWYYSGAPVTKAIFNNLKAGEYTLVVTLTDGTVLSSDLIYVYDKATTFVPAGNKPISL